MGPKMSEDATDWKTFGQTQIKLLPDLDRQLSLISLLFHGPLLHQFDERFSFYYLCSAVTDDWMLL